MFERLVRWLNKSDPVGTDPFATSGTDKPTSILAKMLAAEIIENFEIEGKDVFVSAIPYYKHVFKYPSHEVALRCDNPKPDCVKIYRFDSLSFDGKDLALDSAEQCIIVNAANEAVGLRKRAKAIKAEEDRQHRALDIIANKLGVKA